jgi:tRNA threonylcarbamoyladenosine biosynthesis protein TsaB
MRLYIDTTSSDKLIVALGDRKIEAEARKEKSQMLLPLIDKLLADSDKELTDISEIEVEIGPGSFTGIRVGVSIAQTLGWALKIPVNGKNIHNGETLETKYA